MGAFAFLFDLDGTLTDSRQGIVRGYQHALAGLGRAVPSADALTAYVGPHLVDVFEALLQTDAQDVIERAIALYRDRFERIGMFENAVYPGIADLLTSLGRAGHELRVVTIKPTVYAGRILEHLSIDEQFTAIHGTELRDRQATKRALIQTALRASGVQAQDTLMIGDRAEDIEGARANGVSSVGVTWGYGRRSELSAAGPDRLVDSPEELLEYLHG